MSVTSEPPSLCGQGKHQWDGDLRSFQWENSTEQHSSLPRQHFHTTSEAAAPEETLSAAVRMNN